MLKWLLAVLLILSAAGCERAPTDEAADQYIVVGNGPVQFTFPAGWHKNPKEHPFDLQYFSKFENMNTGVFLFAKEDLAQKVVPRELFEQQIQDMESKRKNFKMVEKEQVVQLKGKKLTTVVYSGEKESSKYYYRFTLIEFAEDPMLIPIVLQISIPSEWSDNKPVLEAITASAIIRSADSGRRR